MKKLYALYMENLKEKENIYWTTHLAPPTPETPRSSGSHCPASFAVTETRRCLLRHYSCREAGSSSNKTVLAHQPTTVLHGEDCRCSSSTQRRTSLSFSGESTQLRRGTSRSRPITSEDLPSPTRSLAK